MLKTVTLEDEEIEILLSHHKQKLADVAKEMQTLSEKQQFSETRLRELTDVHEKEHEASIEEHLSDVVEIQDDGTLTVAAAHEADEHVEEIPAAEAAHEPEAVHEHEEEAPVDEVAHEPETVHEHDEETPVAETSHEPEAALEHVEEASVAEVAHEPEAIHEDVEETPVAEVSHKPEAVQEDVEATPAAEISHEPEAVPHKGTFTIVSES
jgi:fused signal recognition particle receptor